MWSSKAYPYSQTRLRRSKIKMQSSLLKISANICVWCTHSADKQTCVLCQENSHICKMQCSNTLYLFNYKKWKQKKKKTRGKGKGKLNQIILAKWEKEQYFPRRNWQKQAKNDKQENPEERERAHMCTAHVCTHPESSHIKQSRKRHVG